MVIIHTRYMQWPVVWNMERVVVKVTIWAQGRVMVIVVVGVVSVPWCVLWVKGGRMKQAGHWIAFITVYGGDDGSPGRGYCPAQSPSNDMSLYLIPLSLCHSPCNHLTLPTPHVILYFGHSTLSVSRSYSPSYLNHPSFLHSSIYSFSPPH